MSSVNYAVVLHGVNDLRLEQKTTPKPQPDQVRIAVKKVGICMSDVHYWLHGRIGDFIVRSPMVMGHESSGVVVEVGSNVKDLQVGDKVAIEPGIPCRRCKFCKGGRYNLCPDMKFCATPPVDGSLATYFVHDADFCHKLPPSISLEEGALLEPLSVGIHAIQRSGISAGDLVAICGAGPIGLINLLVAKANGAAKVVVTDISDTRLQTARELGADSTVNVNGLKPEEAAKAIRESLGTDLGAEATIECSGSESGARTAVFATSPGGTVVLVGLGNPNLNMPTLDAEVREVDVRGVFRYLNSYPRAMALVSSGLVDLKPLITHRFPKDKAIEAYKTLINGDASVIKVIIECDD